MKNLPFRHRLRFALQGIAHALVTEKSFRVQGAAACGALALLLWSQPAPQWWAAFGIVIAGVLAGELVNTALEGIVDHLRPEIHPAARRVKDCAAAAVLLWSLASLVVFAAFCLDQWGPGGSGSG